MIVALLLNQDLEGEQELFFSGSPIHPIAHSKLAAAGKL